MYVARFGPLIRILGVSNEDITATASKQQRVITHMIRFDDRQVVTNNANSVYP